MKIIDLLKDTLSNKWYGHVDSHGYLKLIKLSDSEIYYKTSLEFYIVFIHVDDPEPKLDGYYNIMEIHDILDFAPIDELELSDKIITLLAKNLLEK